MPITLDLVTYNTWKCDGHYPERLLLIRDALDVLSADLYLLQEVFVSEDNRFNTLREIFSGRHHYHVLFQPARFKHRTLLGEQMRGFSGLAMVSRFAFRAHGVLGLAGHTDDPFRLCQWGLIDAPGGEILTLNTHLTHLSGQGFLRNRQLDQIVGFADRSRYPLSVIGGDMNASPDQLAAADRLQCCFSAPYPSTVNNTPGQCLDQLYSVNDSAIACAWKNTRLLLQGDGKSLLPSDHRAVTSQLHIHRH